MATQQDSIEQQMGTGIPAVQRTESANAAD
jgi:hypothetical protein